jgi:hypothetical protein
VKETVFVGDARQCKVVVPKFNRIGDHVGFGV